MRPWPSTTAAKLRQFASSESLGGGQITNAPRSRARKRPPTLDWIGLCPRVELSSDGALYIGLLPLSLGVHDLKHVELDHLGHLGRGLGLAVSWSFLILRHARACSRCTDARSTIAKPSPQMLKSLIGRPLLR